MGSEASKGNEKFICFSDDELVDELMSRFDDIIIGGRKCLDKDRNCSVMRRRWWKGDYDACVGLMMGASMDCLHKNWMVNEDDIKR